MTAEPGPEPYCWAEAPSLLLSTRKGLPHFVSPDMLPSLPSPDSCLLHLSPLHLLEAVSSRTISKLGGLHQMLGLQDYGFVALPKDSIRCLLSYDGTNKIGASFETPCGRCLIKPSEYVEMISSMRPNIWVTLADEVPAWVSSKRNRKLVDCTLRWMDECISFNVVVIDCVEGHPSTTVALGDHIFLTVGDYHLSEKSDS